MSICTTNTFKTTIRQNQFRPNTNQQNYIIEELHNISDQPYIEELHDETDNELSNDSYQNNELNSEFFRLTASETEMNLEDPESQNSNL